MLLPAPRDFSLFARSGAITSARVYLLPIPTCSLLVPLGARLGDPAAELRYLSTREPRQHDNDTLPRTAAALCVMRAPPMPGTTRIERANGHIVEHTKEYRVYQGSPGEIRVLLSRNFLRCECGLPCRRDRAAARCPLSRLQRAELAVKSLFCFILGLILL